MSQQVVRWEPTLESAQRLAAQTNRLVLIYFCGPSCVYCRRMEAEVLSQPAVAAAINADYVAVKIVADYFPTTAKRYSITHLPTTVITTPQGQWLDSKEGYVAADEYVARPGPGGCRGKTPPRGDCRPNAQRAPPPAGGESTGGEPTDGQSAGGDSADGEPADG